MPLLLLILLSAPCPAPARPTGYDYYRGAYVSLSPIVFVPGKGGSQLEARVRWPLLPHCPKYENWYKMWMDVYTFFTGEQMYYYNYTCTFYFPFMFVTVC